MKLPVPSRKVRLTLSILFLLFSLVFLWWAVGSPMPTPGLAHRATLLSYGLTPGPVEAQGEIHFQEIIRSPNSSEGSRWLVSRQEDGWAVTVHPKAGLFWSQSNSRVQLLTPSEDTPLMAAHLQYASTYLWEEGISENPFDDGDWYWEWVTLAVCTLPDVARIELYQGWYNSIDANGLSPRDWLLEHGSVADCTRLSPDSPFWLCQQVWNPGEGAAATLARAYDAQGNLLCEWCSYDG